MPVCIEEDQRETKVNGRKVTGVSPLARLVRSSWSWMKPWNICDSMKTPRKRRTLREATALRKASRWKRRSPPAVWVMKSGKWPTVSRKNRMNDSDTTLFREWLSAGQSINSALDTGYSPYRSI